MPALGYCHLSFILSSLTCMLLSTSGSGSGSTFLGVSLSHFACEHLAQGGSSIGGTEKMCWHSAHW
jgi:hypothetical protein